VTTTDQDDRRQVRAAIYTRISIAVLDDTTKTDDQERQCRELCQRRGWNVAEVFTDPSKSAWRRDRKRPGWEAMLSAVETGTVNAIVTYWGDRLVRQPRDLEDLLDLREGRSITLASISGQYDFDNDDHRMMMRWEVARACNESDTLSRRKRNQYARMRREGRTRPGGRGGRPFGFERDGVTHVPAEAGALRGAAEAILRGHSIGSVAAGIRAQGLASTAGKPMSQHTLRRLLLSPRVAGLMPGAESKAAWEPVIDRETQEMLRVVLGANKASPRAGRGALYLLSGIALCGVCGHVLYAGHSGGRPGASSYECPPSGCRKITRSMALLDAYVTGTVVAALNDPAYIAAAVPADEGAAAEILAIEQRRAEAEDTIRHLAARPGANLALLASSLDSFDTRLAELRGRMEGAGRARLLGAHAGTTREGFGGLPLEVRRSLVAACFTVRVNRASRRGPGLRTEDIDLIPV
jgi:DNA invertase Pin-like site-specific DNA recombinase